jgi:hypothetical protein
VTATPEDEPNPYQAPASDLDQPAAVDASAVRPGLIKMFRDQAVALGAVWVLLGGVLAAGGGLVSWRAGRDVRLGVGLDMPTFVVGMAVLGLTWLVLGVLTCLKQVGAVYVGLVLSYLALLTQVLTLNFCGSILLILVILQAHRVIRWGNQMRAAGIPMNARQ